jgi:Protein phosphatase 2C
MAEKGSQPPVRGPGVWHVLTASERGAAHDASDKPNQDAVAAAALGSRGALAAVADGHGHGRHFRSARGSRLAVTIACQAVQGLAWRLDAMVAGGQAEDEIRQILVPAIAGQWRDAVRADAEADPFTPDEDEVRGDDDAMIAYGTTLLLAIVWGDWLLLAQIGDGDILGILPDGGAVLPMPADPLLDGRHTTSLCTPGAEDAFRVAAIDTSRLPMAGVMLTTDGYGNAQASEAWEGAVSADLAGLIAAHPPEWLAGQLPAWARRCASADGSADDTSIALLVAPAAARAYSQYETRAP